MFNNILPNRWSFSEEDNIPPATIPLYGITERRVDYLNLSEGMYEVILHVHDVIGVLHKAYMKPSEKSKEDTKSYFSLMVNEEPDTGEGFAYLWDNGRFGHSYFGGSQPIAYVRELLPFEKIELMFKMNSFLKVQKNDFYDLRPEDGVWLERKFSSCEKMWH